MVRLKASGKGQKIRLGEADHSNNFGILRGTRTKETVYDPINESLYALSMTGEVFYAEKLALHAGLVPTNPKVVVQNNSFCGLNKPNGDFVLIGGVADASSKSLCFSADQGDSWTKAQNAAYDNLYFTESTETGKVLAVCKKGGKIYIKRSTDYGASYTDLGVVSGNIGAIKATRVFNTPDHCEFLIQRNDDFTYRHFVYKNDNLTQYSDLPQLKIKELLYSAKIGDDVRFSYVANVTPFELRVYNEDWELVKTITKSSGHKAEGIIFPFGENILLSRWPAPRYWDDNSEEWIKFNSANIGYDMHNIQFFKTKNNETIMINNCDNGLRFKVIASLEDVKDDDKPFIRLQDYHYYAELHGGDAHPDGHLVAAYQDQGTELLLKQSDGSYEALKLGGPDGLESTINSEGTGVWFRHYWQQCWYYKLKDGKPLKKYTFSLDLGSNWNTPRMELTHIPGEESIYMGGKNKVLKATYNPIEDKVELTELPHEFPERVRTVVATAKNPDRMYVSTQEGRFYYSNDRGLTWAESEFTKTKAV